MWFWIAIGAGLASASDKIVIRIALKNQSNIIASSFIYASIISIISLFFSFPISFHLDIHIVTLLLLQGLFWAASTIFSNVSQAQTDVSLSMVISRARMIWMIPLGFLFLNERLSFYSIGGILLIFLGLGILLIKKDIQTHRGVQFMLLSSIAAAIGTTLNVVLVRDYLTAAQVTFTTVFSQAVLFFVILCIKRQPIERIKSVLHSAHLIALAAVIETAAFIGITYAMQIGNASAATAIYLGMTILTIWIGVFILGEKQYMWHKITSSLIVTAGIILVKLFT